MIDFSHDPAVTDALLQWRGRRLFPTDFSSADLQALSKELRLRSVFSARVTNADFLQELQRIVDEMLSGKINQATGRWELLKKLAELGYDPATGFPQDMATIPPAERGSLQDVSSEKRLNLMLETNQRQAANYGRAVAGNTPSALYAFPAWELVRLYVRETPRGTPDSHSIGWQQRWEDAGESVGWEGAIARPMMARKDSPLWLALGEGAGGYSDTLGQPFPPFAFNSGMAWRAVGRDEADRAGIPLEPGEGSDPMKAALSPGQREVQAALRSFGPEFKAELLRELEEAA